MSKTESGTTHRTPSDQLTLDFALKMFLLDGQARNLSPKTFATYEKQIAWFSDFAQTQEIQSLADVHSHRLKNYLLKLQARGWKATSRHVAFLTLRTFFRYCHFDGLLESNPMERVRAPKMPEQELSAYTVDEVKRILTGASQIGGIRSGVHAGGH